VKLSPHEIAHLAISAGFKVSSPPKMDDEAVRFTATVLAESGGDTEVMARSSSGTSVGNRDHGLAQLSGKFQWDKIRDAGGNWRDPAVNVGIAYQIFTDAKRVLSDWSAFTSGAYSEFIPDALIACAHPWPPKSYPSWVDELAHRMES
jgi:hypothetical protein